MERWLDHAAGARTLNPKDNGLIHAYALEINDAGTAVGYSGTYNGTSSLGQRAVRWDAGSTIPVELGNYGADKRGSLTSKANAINQAGLIVGYAGIYVDGSYSTLHATVWMPGSTAPIDLNQFDLVPTNGIDSPINLNEVMYIREDGWASGNADYDPDGAGPSGRRGVSWSAQLGFGGDWTSASGVWGRGVNWSTGTPAMQIGNARFVQPGSASVSLDRDEHTGSILVTNGTALNLELAGHSLSTDGDITITNPATTFRVSTGTLHGNVVHTSGRLAPGLGATAGTLTIDGAYTAGAGATLAIELGGTDSGASDRLNVTGPAMLSGKLEVSLSNGFIALPGQHFDVIGFGAGHSGGVNVVNLTGYAGLSLTTSQSATALTLTAAGTQGDATLNGVVNFDDLLALAKHYGQLAGQDWLDGDFDANGAVNFDDLLALAKHYNTAAGSPASDQAFSSDWALAQSLVPEPTALSLLAASALTLHRRVRK